MKHLALLVSLFLQLTRHLASTAEFPRYPDKFKTRIRGFINSQPNQTFSIEQYYHIIDDKQIGKTIFSTDTDYVRGYIHDDTKNHSIRYNFTDCSLNKLSADLIYKPFDFFSDSEDNSAYVSIVDAFQIFQDPSFTTSVERHSEDGIPKTRFVHAANPESDYPYAISVIVDNALNQIENVLISENSTSDWLVLLRYGAIVTELRDTSMISVPPHDIFCRADHVVKMPVIGKFYSLELRILSEYYKKEETLGIIKISEYIYDGMVSIGFHATSDQNIHYTNIVHNYRSGEGAIINRDMELCTRYTLKLPSNSSLNDQKEKFRTDVLNTMHFFEKKYFVLFWQVLELMKNETTAWQYQGVRVIDSTQCHVWSYPFHASWVAEVAFSVEDIRLRQNSYSNRLLPVPVSVDLYRAEAPSDTLPAIAFRISDYQIDSNPVSTELMYDTGACSEGSNGTVDVQFRLNISYSTVHQYGAGNVRRAVVQALVQKTDVLQGQVRHMSLSPVPDQMCLVTCSVYTGIGSSRATIPDFKERLKGAVDARMYVTFTNSLTDHIQIAYSVPGSLLFNYQSVRRSTNQNWTVSVAATASLCIGTAFIGIVIGITLVTCWNRKKLKGESVSPNYRRFKDEDIEEVDIGMHYPPTSTVKGEIF